MEEIKRLDGKIEKLEVKVATISTKNETMADLIQQNTAILTKLNDTMTETQITMQKMQSSIECTTREVSELKQDMNDFNKNQNLNISQLIKDNLINIITLLVLMAWYLKARGLM